MRWIKSLSGDTYVNIALLDSIELLESSGGGNVLVTGQRRDATAITLGLFTSRELADTWLAEQLIGWLA